MMQPLAPLQSLRPHYTASSIRIYKQGYRNRRRFEKDQQAYVLSRILNQEDYYDDKTAAKTTRDFYHPQRSQLCMPECNTTQLTTISSARHSKHMRHRSQGASVQSNPKLGQERRLKMSELSNIKYIKYRVDPYLKGYSSPLKKYKKSCSIDNRYDFLCSPTHPTPFVFK